MDAVVTQVIRHRKIAISVLLLIKELRQKNYGKKPI
jgi:hypothetical protein